jgi:hypothetical protein
MPSTCPSRPLACAPRRAVPAFAPPSLVCLALALCTSSRLAQASAPTDPKPLPRKPHRSPPGDHAAQTPAPQTLDRVVAVVNNHAILSSDIDEEIRLSILDPALQSSGVLTPQHALEQLISRNLIQQQMRQEDIQAAESPQAEVDARLKEIRTELPACVHANCASDAGWKAFLAAHSLTLELVDASLRYRLQILSFIELRFRQGISVSEQEIAAYYHDKLVPLYQRAKKFRPSKKSPRAFRRFFSSKRSTSSLTTGSATSAPRVTSKSSILPSKKQDRPQPTRKAP